MSQKLDKSQVTLKDKYLILFDKLKLNEKRRGDLLKTFLFFYTTLNTLYFTLKKIGSLSFLESICLLGMSIFSLLIWLLGAIRISAEDKSVVGLLQENEALRNDNQGLFRKFQSKKGKFNFDTRYIGTILASIFILGNVAELTNEIIQNFYFGLNNQWFLYVSVFTLIMAIIVLICFFLLHSVRVIRSYFHF